MLVLVLPMLLSGARCDAQFDRLVASKRAAILAIDVGSGQTITARGSIPKTVPLGSLAKLFAIAPALQRDPALSDRVFRCERNACWLRVGHGPLSIVQAIARSCDAAFLALARGMKRRDLQIAYDRRGLSLPHAKLGDLVTGLCLKLRAPPIDLLRAVASLVTGGILFGDRGVLRSMADDPASIALLRAGMREAMHGTMRLAQRAAPSLAMLGKTGTNGGTGVAVVLFPANSPRVAILAIVARGTGPRDAAPLAGNAARILADPGCDRLSLRR